MTQRDGAGRNDDEVGRGPLSRGAAWIYRVIVLEVMLVVALLPTIAAILLLDRDSSNVPLYVLALLPAGPALVAGLGAARGWQVEPDLSPARPFWRTYRREALGTLTWWVPLLVVVAVLGVNVTHLQEIEGGALLGPVSALLLLLLPVWAAHMAVLQVRFSFRLRDAARIAVAELVPQWRFSLGALSLIVVLSAITLVTTDVVALLLLWTVVLFLHALSRPLVRDVTERFTVHD